jgi:hypothetical protein
MNECLVVRCKVNEQDLFTDKVNAFTNDNYGDYYVDSTSCDNGELVAILLHRKDTDKIEKIREVLREQAIMPEGVYPKLEKIKRIVFGE